jgi:excisionase family DNA binding protein
VNTTGATNGGRTTPAVNFARSPLLDVDAVAVALGVTPRHVRRLVAERRIPFFKVGKFVRFDSGELDIWLDQHRVDVHSSAFDHRTASR